MNTCWPTGLEPTPGSTCAGVAEDAGVADDGGSGGSGGAGIDALDAQGSDGGGRADTATPDAGMDGPTTLVLDCSFPTSTACTIPTGATFVLDTLDTALNVARSTARDGGAYPSLTWDNSDGSPSNGALRITATFTAYGQYVNVQASFPAALDLAGRTVGARIKLVSEMPAGAFVPIAQIHVTTGSNFGYAFSSPINLDAVGTWTDLSFQLGTATANTFVPSMVDQVGIQITAPAPSSDASTALPSPTTLVVELDTITG
jgi:hypothetical protein